MMGVAKAEKLFGILAVPEWRNALLSKRVAAGVEHAPLLRSMPGLRTIVDVGANRGQFALVARHCHPDAQIISFEPLSGPASTYRQLFAGDPLTSLIDTALGVEAGEAVIHVSAQDDSSSLLPITPTQSRVFPGTAEVDTETVRVERLGKQLSAFDIAGPALLKIDVQGFELQVLTGGEDVLAHFDWIYVECSFIEFYAGQALADDVIAWLHDRGFPLSGIYHPANNDSGSAVQADFLFARRAAG